MGRANGDDEHHRLPPRLLRPRDAALGPLAGVSYNPFTKHPEPQHFWQHWDYMGEGPKPVPYKEFVQPLYYRTGGMK